MKRFLPLMASAALFCGAWASFPVQAEEKVLTRAEVEGIVKKVIAENPDLILKTLIEYNEKQKLERMSNAAQNIVKLQSTLKSDPNVPSMGNEKGDVTVTEFFDYHCGFCKNFFPEITRLLQEDKQVRVSFREFPILTQDSVNASRAALAVYSIDKNKYFDYHILLMQSKGEFTESMLQAKAKTLGVSAEAFKTAYDDPAVLKSLAANKELAKKLDITATPTIVIGTEVMPGAISYNTLKAKVEDAHDMAKSKDAAAP